MPALGIISILIPEWGSDAADENWTLPFVRFSLVANSAVEPVSGADSGVDSERAEERRAERAEERRRTDGGDSFQFELRCSVINNLGASALRPRWTVLPNPVFAQCFPVLTSAF